MLRWSWKDKLGTAIIKDNRGKWKCDVYTCNGLFCVIYEYKENGKDMYNLIGYAVDKAHFKRCLKDDLYNGWSWKLNTFFKKEVKDMVNCILDTKPKTKISFYFKKIKGDK